MQQGNTALVGGDAIQVGSVQNAAFSPEPSTGARTLSRPGGRALGALHGAEGTRRFAPIRPLLPPRAESHLLPPESCHPAQAGRPRRRRCTSPLQPRWRDLRPPKPPLPTPRPSPSPEGDQPPGQPALTETGARSLARHQANSGGNRPGGWLLPSFTPPSASPSDTRCSFFPREAPGSLAARPLPGHGLQHGAGCRPLLGHHSPAEGNGLGLQS